MYDYANNKLKMKSTTVKNNALHAELAIRSVCHSKAINVLESSFIN